MSACVSCNDLLVGFVFVIASRMLSTVRLQKMLTVVIKRLHVTSFTALYIIQVTAADAIPV